MTQMLLDNPVRRALYSLFGFIGRLMGQAKGAALYPVTASAYTPFEKGVLSMKKLLVILVAVAVLGGVLYFNLGSAAKRLIEQAGTEALGTPVHVSDFSFNLADKKAAMGHLWIENPKCYSGAILKTQSIAFTVDEISQTLVVLKEVDVDGMYLAYDMGARGTNFDALHAGMKSSPKGASSVPAPKLVIKKLKIRDAKLATSFQGMAAQTVSMPDIVLTDVGTKSKPATAAEAAGQIMDRILNAGTNAVMKNKLTAPIGDAIDKGKGKLKGLFK